GYMATPPVLCCTRVPGFLGKFQVVKCHKLVLFQPAQGVTPMPATNVGTLVSMDVKDDAGFWL
ncbi:hypothetical protein NL524_29825, partial [Klebsiella pneumoniae]|nr:hypothetical protein [Klebsiella pneumoniae]